MHIGVTAAVFGLSYVLQKWYDARNVEKDAMYRHYISIHPEEFPMPGMNFHHSLILLFFIYQLDCSITS